MWPAPLRTDSSGYARWMHGFPGAPTRILLALATVVLVAAGGVLIADWQPGPVRSTPTVPSPTVSEPAVGADPAAALPLPPAAARTGRRVTALLADDLLRVRGTVSVAVLDEAGRVVVDHGAERRLIPASTQKLPTAAAALQLLGSDFRYVTRATATARLSRDGVLPGDLTLVGDGDPALGTPLFGQVFPDRPRTRLEDLVDRLEAAGLTRVEGGVVGDASAFAGEPLAAGWKAEYLEDRNARMVSGLTVDAGLRYRVTGDPPVLRELETAADPAFEAAAALMTLLEERGIPVDGNPGTTAAPQPGRTIASVTSPPLGRLLEHTLEHSDNHMADAIFRTLAPRSGPRDWAAAEQAARGALADLGVDADGAVMADGSGLSRADRLSAGLLVRLARAMTSTDDGMRWQRFQAVTGREGTLRRWLVGTVAAGRFAGKSGSLDDVRAVTGTVRGPGDRLYHLAVIVNDLVTEDVGRARVLMQTLILALAADLHGCEPPRVEPARGVPVIVPGACSPSVAAAPEVPR